MKTKMSITHKLTSEVLFKGEYETLKDMVQSAYLTGANLTCANLTCANLGGAKIKISQKDSLLVSIGIKIEGDE